MAGDHDFTSVAENVEIFRDLPNGRLIITGTGAHLFTRFLIDSSIVSGYYSGMDSRAPAVPTDYLVKPCTAFAGTQLLAAGPLIEVVLAVKNAIEGGSSDRILVFDDTTGRAVDFDLRGTKSDVIARLSRPSIAGTEPTILGQRAAEQDPTEPRGRGRPKLGVIGREVTLLPRQWEWLATQPGGASVVLRKLVDEAKRNNGGIQKRRAAQEAAYHFMSAMAGDMPGFEEAARALFANDRTRFDQEVAIWPGHVRTYATRLAFGGPADEPPAN
jgi:hypothetical protein